MWVRKLIDAINRSVVPPVCSAAKRNPWFAQNTHATNFLCSIEQDLRNTAIYSVFLATNSDIYTASSSFA
ncbi:MAG: hypothetical protein O4859_14525 [Trichodesmium sp. St18_bin1]|nr:hypothetical protein [Trichodesmium sp. St18_bin1]